MSAGRSKGKGRRPSAQPFAPVGQQIGGPSNETVGPQAFAAADAELNREGAPRPGPLPYGESNMRPAADSGPKRNFGGSTKYPLAPGIAPQNSPNWDPRTKTFRGEPGPRIPVHPGDIYGPSTQGPPLAQPLPHRTRPLVQNRNPGVNPYSPSNKPSPASRGPNYIPGLSPDASRTAAPPAGFHNAPMHGSAVHVHNSMNVHTQPAPRRAPTAPPPPKRSVIKQGPPPPSGATPGVRGFNRPA